MSEQQETPKVFDRAGSFTIGLKRLGKSVTVRFPSDEEIIRRESQMRTFFRKGNSIPEVEGQDGADADLFAKIRTGGDEIPEGNVSRALGILLSAAVPDAPERTADGYSIGIDVVGGIHTEHQLREPTEKEIRKYRQASLFIGDVRFGRQEAKTHLREVGVFYDKLAKGASGYSSSEPSAIPLSHKALAVNAMLQQIRSEEEADEVDPAENFL